MTAITVYEYRSHEVPLGNFPVTGTGLIIEELNLDSDTFSARGTVNCTDHTEGCSFECSWSATGSFNSSYTWEVACEDRTGFCDPGTGKPVFTISPPINEGIKGFISEKLTYAATRLRAGGVEGTIIETVPVYNGTPHEYTGPCVCNSLVASCDATPFDWSAHTNGGQFPKRCFKCSCGTLWFQGEENRWAHVADSETWDALMTYDGNPVEQIVVKPNVEFPTVILLRTLRQQGMIPL